MIRTLWQILGDSENFNKILERKGDLAVRGEKMAQQRLCEAEADVEVKHWEKRNSDIALYEINQEFESDDYSYNKRIGGQILLKEKSKLAWRIGIENRFFQECQAKDCQEIEELRRICCEETDRARQARID